MLQPKVQVLGIATIAIVATIILVYPTEVQVQVLPHLISPIRIPQRKITIQAQQLRVQAILVVVIEESIRLDDLFYLETVLLILLKEPLH